MRVKLTFAPRWNTKSRTKGSCSMDPIRIACVAEWFAKVRLNLSLAP